jgi:hypothetical protein
LSVSVELLEDVAKEVCALAVEREVVLENVGSNCPCESCGKSFCPEVETYNVPCVPLHSWILRRREVINKRLEEESK